MCRQAVLTFRVEREINHHDGVYFAVVVAVIGFGSSAALGSAYDIAVTGTMVLTTIMAFYVMRYRWNFPLWRCGSITVIFLSIETFFLASNVLKIHEGGWYTLVIASTGSQHHTPSLTS